VPVYRRDDVTGTVDWYVYDGLGSVVEEVAPNGTVAARLKYDVYSAVRSRQAGTSSQKFVGKLGHEIDASTGLIYMRARYYDPATGRFLSEDPKGQGENWFAYCSGNPVNYQDESGCSPGWVATMPVFLTMREAFSMQVFFASMVVAVINLRHSPNDAKLFLKLNILVFALLFLGVSGSGGKTGFSWQVLMAVNSLLQGAPVLVSIRRALTTGALEAETASEAEGGIANIAVAGLIASNFVDYAALVDTFYEDK
jgi:RHS repeat-associated protein